MKLWRKLARKQPSGDWSATTNIHTGEVVGRDPIMKRNGRDLAYQFRLSEQIGKYTVKTYPLLDSLIQHAGLKFVMSKKEEARLKEMVESVSKENIDETK